jgi:hypothetical protein
MRRPFALPVDLTSLRGNLRPTPTGEANTRNKRRAVKNGKNFTNELPERLRDFPCALTVTPPLNRYRMGFEARL